MDRDSAMRWFPCVVMAAVLVALAAGSCTSSGSGGARSSIDSGTSSCPVPGEILTSQGQCAQSVGNYCQADSDCASDRCLKGVCAAPPAPNGDSCSTDSDCTSGVCDTAVGRCGVQPDGTRCLRGQECSSGICPCGSAESACSHYDASTCGPRPNGGLCGSDQDCASGACDVPERRCGPQPSGSACARGSDCSSGACSSGTCVVDAGAVDAGDAGPDAGGGD